MVYIYPDFNLIFGKNNFSSEIKLPNAIINSALLFIVVFLSFSCFSNRAQYLFLHIIYILIVIPNYCLSLYGSNTNLFFISGLLLIISLIFFQYRTEDDNVKNNILINNWILYISLIVGFLILLPQIYFSSNLFNFDLFLFLDVYDVREKSREIHIPILGYFYGVFHNFINPFILIYALYNRKYLIFLISFFLGILFFLLFAQKITLIVLVISVIFLHLNQQKQILLLYLILFVSLFSYIFLSEEYLVIKLTIGGLLNRLLYLPAIINTYYFDFFENKSIYFSDTTLLKYFSFHDYRFNYGVPFVIGEYYFNNSETSANSGIISDGFVNLGVFGLFLFTYLLAKIILIIKKFNFGSIYFGFYFSFFILIQNSFLFSFFISQGFLFFLLFILLFVKFKFKSEVR